MGESAESVVRHSGSAGPSWPLARLMREALLPIIAGLAMMLAGPQVEAAPKDRSTVAAPAKAAYFYHYMPASHLDSLAARGFTRALVHWNTDSLDTRGRIELDAFTRRAHQLGLELVPEFVLQAPSRLAARPPARRYTWGRRRIEAEIACPLDSAYWTSALIGRFEEFLEAQPTLTRLAVDLELYRGSLHHYDAGPCQCAVCLAEYSGGGVSRPRGWSPGLAGLHGWEEGRIEAFLIPLLSSFHARHPGVRIEVLDLDYESFVHRALARAIATAGIPVTDDCERSYAGGEALAGVRERLAALGLPNAELVGGLWLKRVAPDDLERAVGSILAGADGVFVFTTYSLWLEPERLQGPYTLPAPASEYWPALERTFR